MIISKILRTGGQTYLRRSYATGTKLVETTRDKDTGIDIVSMARAPANSLNVELLDALKTSLLEAQNNKRKGVILTSSLPTIFSSGLDLSELFETDKKRLTDFWSTLQDTWLTLYSLDIPIAAAINGSSPAGGCLLAISTEYRVFVEGKRTIGFSETRLNLTAPKWIRDLYVSLLGYRQAELALLKGSLFKPEEALKIKLVDELARDKADAIEKCKNYILSFSNIPSLGRTNTKLEMRNELIQWMKENKEVDSHRFADHVLKPNVQHDLKVYIKNLKQKQ